MQIVLDLAELALPYEFRGLPQGKLTGETRAFFTAANFPLSPRLEK
jgi:hypothetical protein